MMAILRYSQWIPTVFFGDDLQNYIYFLNGDFASTLTQSLFGQFSEKYRPVFQLIIGRLFGLFGPKIDLYFIVNFAIHTLSALIVFAIAFRLSQRSILVGCMSAILAVTTRFALYQVTQVTGLLEGIGHILFVTIIYLLIRFEQEERKMSARIFTFVFFVLFLEFLIVHTHERYIVIVPWIVFMFLLISNFKLFTITQRVFIIGIAIAPAIINIVAKKLLFHTSFFVGPAAIPMKIDLHQMQTRFVEAFLSIFGFNYGPGHLVGRSIALNPDTFGWQMALLFTLGWLILLVLAVTRKLSAIPCHDVKFRSNWPFMFLALIGLLLLPPVMTIRIEQRWLVQPFLILIMISAWATGTLENRLKSLGIAVFTVLSVASFSVDSYLSSSFSGIFFVYSAKAAEIIKRDIVDVDVSDKKPLLFIAGTDVGDWILMNGEFFRLYGGQKRFVACFDDISQLRKKYPENIDDCQIVMMKPDAALDITDDIRAMRVMDDEVQSIDLLALYQQERANSNTHYTDTPFGQGASILSWETRLGKVKCLNIISGCSYTYNSLLIAHNSALRFDVGMPFQTQEPVRVIVKVIGTDGHTEIVYEKKLLQETKKEPLKLIPVSRSLEKYSGEKISIEFSVEPFAKSSIGHQIAFGRPRIVCAD